MKNKNLILLVVATVTVLSIRYVLNSSQTKLQSPKSPLPFQRTQSRGNKEKDSSATVVGTTAFTIADNFVFPHALNTFKDVKKIASTKWVRDLALIMTRWPINQTVIVVSGNANFQKPLLNWLISAVLKANVSLDHILILSADQNLHKLLQRRNIGSIFVPPSSVYDNKTIKLSTHKLITYLRFAVVRLLNHWGFTVAHYDSDALLLKDMQEIFEKYPSSSIVASIAVGLYEVNMCAGAILFRSNQEIGIFNK